MRLIYKYQFIGYCNQINSPRDYSVYSMLAKIMPDLVLLKRRKTRSICTLKLCSSSSKSFFVQQARIQCSIETANVISFYSMNVPFESKI